MRAGQTRDAFSKKLQMFQGGRERKTEQETEQSAARAPILTICRSYLKIGMQRFVFLLESRKKRFRSYNENAATSPMNRAAMFVCSPLPKKKEGLSTYCFNDPAARITSYLLSVSQQPLRLPFLPDLQTSEGPFMDEMG